MLDNFREWLSDNLRYILLGLAILAVLGVTDALDMSSAVNGGTIGSLLVLAVMVACVFRFSRKAKKS